MMMMLSCRSCQGRDVVIDYCSGDSVCTRCGLVLGQRLMPEEAEWRTFGGDADSRGKSDPVRVGGGERAADRITGNALVTMLQSTGGSSSSNNSNSSTLARCQARRKKQQRAAEAMVESLSQVCDRLLLPQRVTDCAMGLLKDLVDLKNAGKVRLHCTAWRKALAPACAYAACRLQRTQRGLKEVGFAGGVRAADVGKAFLKLKKVLNISQTDTGVDDAAALVPRLCSGLPQPRLNHATVRLAQDLAAQASTRLAATASAARPTSIAAAAVWLATQCSSHEIDAGDAAAAASGRSMADVAKAGEVAARTLRHTVLRILGWSSQSPQAATTTTTASTSSSSVDTLPQWYVSAVSKPHSKSDAGDDVAHMLHLAHNLHKALKH